MHPSIFSFRCLNVEVTVPSVPILSSPNKTLRSWEVGRKSRGQNLDFSGAKLGSISLTDSCIWPKFYTGVSKNRGTPKWMVYNGKPYFLMDDLGGKPTIFRNTHMTHMKLQYLLQKADKVRRVACRHSSCNFRLPQSWLKLPGKD